MPLQAALHDHEPLQPLLIIVSVVKWNACVALPYQEGLRDSGTALTAQGFLATLHTHVVQLEKGHLRHRVWCEDWFW